MRHSLFKGQILSSRKVSRIYFWSIVMVDSSGQFDVIWFALNPPSSSQSAARCPHHREALINCDLLFVNTLGARPAA